MSIFSLKIFSYFIKDENYQNIDINDLSDLLTTTVTWYLISNLPTPFLKSLQIENSTLSEKLKNGLV